MHGVRLWCSIHRSTVPTACSRPVLDVYAPVSPSLSQFSAGARESEVLARSASTATTPPGPPAKDSGSSGGAAPTAGSDGDVIGSRCNGSGENYHES